MSRAPSTHAIKCRSCNLNSILKYVHDVTNNTPFIPFWCEMCGISLQMQLRTSSPASDIYLLRISGNLDHIDPQLLDVLKWRMEKPHERLRNALSQNISISPNFTLGAKPQSSPPPPHRTATTATSSVTSTTQPALEEQTVPVLQPLHGPPSFINSAPVTWFLPRARPPTKAPHHDTILDKENVQPIRDWSSARTPTEKKDEA